MRVLLLRPREESLRSAARLRALGYEPIVSPLLCTVAVAAPAPAVAPQAIVATSANAFRHLPPTFAQYSDRAVFVVGTRTAAAARAQGFDAPALVASDVGELGRELARRLDRGARVLYLAGAVRKPDLEQALTRAAIAFNTSVVYTARARAAFSDEAWSALRERRIDCVLHYSSRSAALFCACAERQAVEDAAADAIHIAISADAGEPLRAIARDLRIAPAKNERSMFDVLNDARGGR